MSFDVLFEDNHLLAVSKSAGVPTMGASQGRPSLLSAAKAYIKQKYNKPGNVYLGVVSRLDAPVTGVVLFARTSKAAARLTNLYRLGQVRKVYWALTEDAPQPKSGPLNDWLHKDERRRRMEVCGESADGAKEARLEYRTLRRLRSCALLEVVLQTGRKHQIRVQLAHRGWPIVGDRKYGGWLSFGRGIGLHSRQLELRHPVRGTPLDLVAPLPDRWGDFDAALRQTGA